jgi:two-component system, OmpR family, response regulator
LGVIFIFSLYGEALNNHNNDAEKEVQGMLTAPGKKCVLLVISSDSDLSRVLEFNLPPETYQIRTTKINDDNLKGVLEVTRPDSIIVDINMPWLGGLELSLRIRQYTGIPILLFTTWGAHKNELRGLDLGSESYLTDSLNQTQIIALVQGAFKQSFAGVSAG